MKKFLAFFVSLFLTACGSAPSSSDFSLELTLQSEELSEDSNSEMETLQMEGPTGSYTWSYEGDHADPNFVREKEEDLALSAEDLEALKLFIEDHALNQNISEEAPYTDMGRRVELELNLTMDGEESTLHLSGMSAIWGEGEGGTNVEHFELVEAAQDLIFTIRDLSESEAVRP